MAYKILSSNKLDRNIKFIYEYYLSEFWANFLVMLEVDICQLFELLQPLLLESLEGVAAPEYRTLPLQPDTEFSMFTFIKVTCSKFNKIRTVNKSFDFACWE